MGIIHIIIKDLTKIQASLPRLGNSLHNTSNWSVGWSSNELARQAQSIGRSSLRVSAFTAQNEQRSIDFECICGVTVNDTTTEDRENDA